MWLNRTTALSRMFNYGCRQPMILFANILTRQHYVISVITMFVLGQPSTKLGSGYSTLTHVVFVAGKTNGQGNIQDRFVLFLSLIHISEPTRRTPISYAVFC